MIAFDAIARERGVNPGARRGGTERHDARDGGDGLGDGPAVRAVRPSTAIVVGGSGLPDEVVEQPGLRRCRRAPDVVPVVDGLVQRASLN